MNQIASRRLIAHRLVGEPLASPVEVVRWLGAVQSQDYTGAKWALAQRSRQTSEVELDRLFDAGSILRTHVLRPTWHFVLPEDVRWLTELTGPRVQRGLAGRYRQLDIDAKLITRSNLALTTALAGGRHLTRPEIGQVLANSGIETEGQRLAHLIMAAELQGLIVSGPRRDKEFTYALLDERAPAARRLDHSEALCELALRYFRSHGPARVSDFVWWSGLTAAEARLGVEAAGVELERVALDGNEYWSGHSSAPRLTRSPTAHLLPNFDEYTVAYRDRDAQYVDGPFDPSLFPFGSILANVVAVDGRVRGTWRRATSSGVLRLEIRLMRKLEDPDREAVEQAGRTLARFLCKPVELAWL